MGVTPDFFGVNDFGELESVRNLGSIFRQPSYLQWRSFREFTDSRYVGFAMPHVLMRLPYEDDGEHRHGFRYQEDVSGPDKSKYLWGNASFAFGEVLLRAFGESSWLANIRGVQRNIETGGIVTGLPVHNFSTDASGIAPKSSTDAIITDAIERDISELGFLPLCHCQDTEFSAFFSNESAHKPRQMNDAVASRNERISKMLQYMFCSSRFAHYLKVIARDKLGSFSEPAELQDHLQNWIAQYVTPDKTAGREQRARFPLYEAEVLVRSTPGDPGHFQSSIKLLPHFELDELQAAVRLSTKMKSR